MSYAAASCVAGRVVRGAVDEHVAEADHLDDFLEDRRAAGVDEPIEHAADGRIAGQARGDIRAAAFAADDQIGERHLDARRVLQLVAEAGDDRLALFDAGDRAAALLNEEPLGRPARFADARRRAARAACTRNRGRPRARPRRSDAARATSISRTAY